MFSLLNHFYALRARYRTILSNNEDWINIPKVCVIFSVMECNTLSYLFFKTQNSQAYHLVPSRGETVWGLFKKIISILRVKWELANCPNCFTQDFIVCLCVCVCVCVCVYIYIHTRLPLKYRILFSSCITTKLSWLWLTSVNFSISSHFLGSIRLLLRLYQ